MAIVAPARTDGRGRRFARRCGQTNASARVVRESADEVIVAAFAYVPDDRAKSACSFMTVDGRSLNADLPLQLAAPLGDRDLVDARSGRPVGIIAHDYLPAPTYVPDGFTASSSTRFDPPADIFAQRWYTRTDGGGLQVRVESQSTAIDGDLSPRPISVGGVR